jgi:flagellar protein FliJ
MFRFRLETLLRLRVNDRDQRRADLAKALRAEQMLHEEAAKLRGLQATTAQRGRALKSPGAANIDALLETHRYEVVLAAQQRQLASQLTQVQAESERRRQALVEADRQVRVLEKLRERQAAVQRNQAERREAKQLDELALLGFVYRQEPLT